MDTPEKSQIPSKDTDVWLIKPYISTSGILYQARSQPYKAGNLPTELLARTKFYSLTDPNLGMKTIEPNVVESEKWSLYKKDERKVVPVVQVPDKSKLNDTVLKEAREVFIEKEEASPKKPLLDLRTASLEQLVDLPHVGTKTANRVIEAFQSNGNSINSLRDLDSFVKLPFGRSWESIGGIFVSPSTPIQDQEDV